MNIFSRQRLKIYLYSEDSAIDEEVFDLAGLEKWHLKQRFANDYLNQVKTNVQHLSAEGLLPHGPAAHSCVAAISHAQENLLLQLRPFYGEKAEPRNISLSIDSNILLNGSVEHYYPKLGLMEFTSSKLQGKHLLSLWVKHLAMCATKQFNKDETSCLICSDQTMVFSQIEAQQAQCQLADYVGLFQQGVQLPLPIFPAASYAFAHNFCKKGDAEKATSAAHKAWQSNSWGGYSTGDFDDAYIQLALRNNLQDPLATESFREHAQTIYELALSNGEFS